MNPSWINEAITLYNDKKLTYEQIGEIVGANRKTVSYYLRQNGIQSNPLKARKIDPKKLRKYDYSICEQCFENIDCEEKAYWLGFLYADGCVNSAKNTIELSLKEEDKEHLIKYRKFLGLEEKPFTIKEKNINGVTKISYRFSFDSAKVKKDLVIHGCSPGKTFELKFPTFLPEKLKSHFIRGYIDGDGCIYVNNKKISLEVLGTEEFLKGYKEWANEGNSKIYNCSKSEIKRVINSNKQALNILERLYKNATIYLERKHKKYIDFCRLGSTVVGEPRLLVEN